MKRLCELMDRSAPAVVNRRGPARQRRRREREQRLRGHVVDFAQWTRAQGWRLDATAALLHLSPRTLRQWCHDRRQRHASVRLLGRPTQRGAVSERNEVIALLDELGPRLGVPTLQSCFPRLARAELADLLGRYRRLWRLRQRQALCVLHWQVAGSVWAMDFAEAPLPIDGIYPYLLAVRDLASGMQLLWQPLRAANAIEASAALVALFVQHGAPLVLKTDNGSPFCADVFMAVLQQWRVLALFSPPYWPRYNGSAEAGIGSSKSRTEEHAGRAGHPGDWSYDDAAAAPAEANATARPHGPSGPTPEAHWQCRRPISLDARAHFAASVAQQRCRARQEGGWPLAEPLSEQDRRAVDRVAIRRALEEHGFLLYSRRRIALPFPGRKTARLS
jgi:hypothetical protein